MGLQDSGTEEAVGLWEDNFLSGQTGSCSSAFNGSQDLEKMGSQDLALGNERAAPVSCLNSPEQSGHRGRVSASYSSLEFRGSEDDRGPGPN